MHRSRFALLSLASFAFVVAACSAGEGERALSSRASVTTEDAGGGPSAPPPVSSEDAGPASSLVCSPPQTAVDETITATDWNARPVTSSPQPDVDPNWTLTFKDEFDRTVLNPSGQNIWGTTYFSSQAFYSMDGDVLHLQVNATQPNSDGAGRVSSISSQASFSQQYGWFEIRARTAKGSGLLNAFWLQPLDSRYFNLVSNGGDRTDERESYEVDIFEQPGLFPSNNTYTTHAGDSGNDPAHLNANHITELPFDQSADFHVYAVDWNPTQVTWYIDGKVVFTSTFVPRTPMWIYVNLYADNNPTAAGEGATQPGQFDAGPASFDIDYVHVFQRLTPECP